MYFLVVIVWQTTVTYLFQLYLSNILCVSGIPDHVAHSEE